MSRTIIGNIALVYYRLASRDKGVLFRGECECIIKEYFYQYNPYGCKRKHFIFSHSRKLNLLYLEEIIFACRTVLVFIEDGIIPHSDDPH